MIRRTSPQCYDQLLAALVIAEEDEMRAMLDAVPELLLKAQGRASVTAELLARALVADERITEVEQALAQQARNRHPKR